MQVYLQGSKASLRVLMMVPLGRLTVERTFLNPLAQGSISGLALAAAAGGAGGVAAGLGKGVFSFSGWAGIAAIACTGASGAGVKVGAALFALGAETIFSGGLTGAAASGTAAAGKTALLILGGADSCAFGGATSDAVGAGVAASYGAAGVACGTAWLNQASGIIQNAGAGKV